MELAVYVYVFVFQERNIQLNFHNFILRYGPFVTYHRHRNKWQMDVKAEREHFSGNNVGQIKSEQ